MMADTMQQHDYESSCWIETTIHRSSVDQKGSQYQKMHGEGNLSQNLAYMTQTQMILPSEYHNSQIVTKAYRGLNLRLPFINCLTRMLQALRPSRITCLLLLIFLCTNEVKGQALSQSFLNSYSSSSSRFMNFAGKAQRDIVVRLTKNITEDTPVGTLLATFRAEDSDSLAHNLTLVSAFYFLEKLPQKSIFWL